MTCCSLLPLPRGPGLPLSLRSLADCSISRLRHQTTGTTNTTPPLRHWHWHCRNGIRHHPKTARHLLDRFCIDSSASRLPRSATTSTSGHAARPQPRSNSILPPHHPQRCSSPAVKSTLKRQTSITHHTTTSAPSHFSTSHSPPEWTEWLPTAKRGWWRFYSDEFSAGRCDRPRS